MSANKWAWVLLVTVAIVVLGVVFMRPRTSDSQAPSPNTTTEAAGLHTSPRAPGSGLRDADGPEPSSLGSTTKNSQDTDKTAPVRVGLAVDNSHDATELSHEQDPSYVDPNSILRKLAPIEGGDAGILAAHQSSDAATRKARAAEIEEALELVQSLESKDQLDADLYSRLKQEAAWLRGHPDP